ncbi:MAG: iron donor protein CyaY [Thiomonas sp.]|uniref:iron donor protein CyaY n=1 Tax=Thiomonas sp. TaxID=2047785 RepID=UPI002A3653D4|nr:iron donor protein CyaY [Thiomonas sp.]MDY0329791.1 iron donor protein CyaY [Thiomonas sp.]
MSAMPQSDYFRLAEAMLAAVEAAADKADVDTRRDGAVLTLTLDNKERIIINLQAPLQELWLASQSGAHHFRCSAQQWRDTRTGQGFAALLQAAVTAQGGPDLQLG